MIHDMLEKGFTNKAYNNCQWSQRWENAKGPSLCWGSGRSSQKLNTQSSLQNQVLVCIRKLKAQCWKAHRSASEALKNWRRSCSVMVQTRAPQTSKRERSFSFPLFFFSFFSQATSPGCCHPHPGWVLYSTHQSFTDIPGTVRHYSVRCFLIYSSCHHN